MGVSPLQLVNLHRNRRYFVIKLHTWFYLSYFLKTNIKCYCIYQNVMSINSFFQHRICFSIQPPDYQWDKSRDYTCYSQWPVTHFSTFYQFILNMLFNHKIINSTNIKQTKPISILAYFFILAEFMILYCKESFGCIDNNNIELINNIY